MPVDALTGFSGERGLAGSEMSSASRSFSGTFAARGGELRSRSKRSSTGKRTGATHEENRAFRAEEYANRFIVVFSVTPIDSESQRLRRSVSDYSRLIPRSEEAIREPCRVVLRISYLYIF